ncbi:MAG: NPCBM/NEW2 domain-containing protein, partial [Kiritimatiellales bacterium]
GRKIPWSLNGAGPVNPVDQVFDFRIGEYQSHMNQPQTLLVMSRYAANAGKMQALISMVDGNWDQHPEQFVFETRKHIATAYASGMLPLVPWCMYMHQAPRYYGSIEDFGDLYQFVSNYRELFDGYALVAASGVDTQSNLYQWMPNKEIVWPRASGRSLFSIGRENVFALLRSNGTSRVIHVVDWNANPASFDLSFNPQEVIGTEVADLTVLRPGQDLLKISGYAGGSVEIPALSPWGLIQVAPAKSVSSMVVAPKVVEPSRCVVAEGTVVDIQVPSDCTGWVRCPGKQEFVEFDAKRRPILVNSGFLEIFSRRTVDGAESRHLRVSVQVYMSFMADFPVGGSGMDITDRFTCTKGLMKVNESFVGDSLRLGGVPVQGISAQGESMLSCGIDPAWKFFTVHAGIDDAEDRRPCLRFQVWLDDRLAYESSIVNPSKGVIADEDRDVFDIAVRIPEEAKTLRLVAAKSGFFADQNNIVWSSPTAYSDEGK